MSLRLGGDGAITGCSSLSEPALTLSGLTVSGQIFTVSGTAAAPGITFVDDSDTGIYSPAANQVAITTSGAHQVRVTADGNVGIGTVAPTQRLVVSDTDTTVASFDTNQTTTRLRLRTGLSSDVYVGAVDTNSFFVNTNGTERLRIDNNGNVGIGTTSPTEKLEVAGSVRAGNFTGQATTTAMTFGLVGTDTAVVMYGTGGSPASTMLFRAGSNERMRIDSSGRLLVGTTNTLDTSYSTSGGKLQVTGATLPVIISTYTNDIYGARIDFVKSRSTTTNGKTIVVNGDQLGNIIWGGTDGTNVIPAATITANVDATPGTNDMPGRLVFLTTADGAAAPAERVRITSAGRMGVATSNPGAYLHVNSGGQATSSLNTGGDLSLIVSDGGTAVNNGGAIVFAAATGSWRFAAIKGLVTDGANNTRGDLAFCTRGVSTDATLTERMRITRDGAVRLSNPTASPAYASNTVGCQVSGGVLILNAAGSASVFGRNNNGAVQFFQNNGSVVGNITVTATNTAYNTTSDYRLKENVVDIADGITRVKQLLPKRFNFIAKANTIVDGFLAHEAQAIVPEAVTGNKDEVDDDGNAVMQGIDHSKLVPLLTAALKEAISKIEILESEVATLKAST